MKVVCTKTLINDVITGVRAPDEAIVYKDEIYTVVHVDVVSNRLVYWFAECPDYCNYLAKHFIPLSKFNLEEVNINELTNILKQEIELV